MTIRKRYFLFISTTALMLLSVCAFSSGRLIDIGEGRKMFMECKGVGSPTVILISGYPDRGDASWETLVPGQKGPTVVSAVSQFTEVCNYDRPGTIKVIEDELSESRSDPVPQPVTSHD